MSPSIPAAVPAALHSNTFHVVAQPDDLQCTGGGDTFVVPGSLSGSVLQFHYPEGRPTTTMIVDTIGQLVEDGLDGNSVEPPDIYADEGFSICHDPDADTDTETDLYLAFEGEQQFWGGQVEDLTPEDANGHLILATKKFADYSKYKIRIFPCDSNDDDDASFEDDF